MKGADFILNINEIDLDLIEGAAIQKKKKTSMVRFAGIMAACICLVLGSVFGIKALRNKNAGAEAGGTDGKLNVTSEIVLTGTENALSVEDAKAYLDTFKDGIVNELTASGIQVNDLSFSPWGVSILRSGDKGNSMAVDWKQFNAYDGDKLVAIIDLCKDSSGIHHYIAFGGPWFDEYNELLKSHAGEELVMIYAGDVQAFVTPANEVLCVNVDGHFKESIEEGKDYYNYFKQEQNTFVP